MQATICHYVANLYLLLITELANESNDFASARAVIRTKESKGLCSSIKMDVSVDAQEKKEI